MLYTEFQSPTMPGTSQKVCVVRWGGGVGVSLFLFFSFGQAEQKCYSKKGLNIMFETKLSLDQSQKVPIKSILYVKSI